MTCLLIYMTAPSAEDAQKIAETLVTERLVACVNMLPPMTSVYRWEGKVVSGAEVALIAKTSAAQWDAVQQRVRELHPYDVPCLVGCDIAAGLPEFLSWIIEETQ